MLGRLAAGLHDLVGERSKADIEHLELLLEKAHRHASLRRADDVRRELDRLGIAAGKQHAGLAKSRFLARQILRIGRGAADEADDRECRRPPAARAN